MSARGSAAPPAAPSELVRVLLDVHAALSGRIDGGVLLTEALAANPALAPAAGEAFALLAVGKAAFPMTRGLTAAGLVPAAGLVIAPEALFPDGPLDAALPARVGAVAADHPTPTARSVAAARAARALLARLGPRDALVVLLSGGASALMAEPAPGLTLDDKLALTSAVARAGAAIGELNAVRKHLSAIKGGRLALATPARVTVLALSDVIGDDPATIGSGPFSPDPTTYAAALALVRRLAPDAAGAARAHIQRGAAGGLDETPKPGDRRLAHVAYHVVAGPARAAEEARQAIEAAAFQPGLLSRDVESDVVDLAAAYAERARREAASAGVRRVFVGNGEPRVRLPAGGGGCGGRATHLALLMARFLAGLPGVAFLAAGTDDRDGSAEGCGAAVDGQTWARAMAAGLDPEGALARFDSASVFDRLRALVRGPGTSNLLDVHLLAVDGQPPRA